jgi:signal transduction histidine kinase
VPAARRRPLLVVTAVVLVSSAGLLAAGLVSLWHSARAAEESAAVADERAAFLTARTIAARLRDPGVVAGFAAEGRGFRIAEGRLVLPEGFTWAGEPPPESVAIDVPISILARVDDAERQERAGAADGAQRAFDEALAQPGLSPRVRRWVLQLAGWSAQRAGASAARDARLDALAAELPPATGPAAGFAPDQWFRSTVAGFAALSRATGRELGAARWHAIAAALTDAELDALLAEIAATPLVQDALDAIARARLERRVLAVVAHRVARLTEAKEPSVEAVDGELLLYLPDRGAGALVAPAAAAGELPDAGQVRLVLGPDPPADAVPAAPLVSVRPLPPPRVSPFSRLGGLALLIVFLAATFGVGLFVALRMLRREAQLQEERARFLTNVTHELKTPLASIRLFAEMLLDGRVASEEKRAEYHRLLAGEAERLSHLIESVLEVGRVERAAPRRVGRVDLSTLIAEVLARFAPVAQSSGLALETPAVQGAIEAWCDRDGVTRALLNVLENCAKYAAAGGRVVVELSRAESVARIGVRDFGPGIAPEDSRRIFEPFVRGTRQEDGATPGLGLGLHLARTLLQRDGGSLRLDAPADGPGARFVLSIPLAPEGGGRGDVEARAASEGSSP